jgi:hypothetical protein
LRNASNFSKGTAQALVYDFVFVIMEEISIAGYSEPIVPPPVAWQPGQSAIPGRHHLCYQQYLDYWVKPILFCIISLYSADLLIISWFPSVV